MEHVWNIFGPVTNAVPTSSVHDQKQVLSAGTCS